MNQTQEVQSKGVEIIAAHPEGIKWSQLVKEVGRALPHVNPNSPGGMLWKLDQITKLVYKPERGLWQHVKFKQTEPEAKIVSSEAADAQAVGVKEEDFYKKFAEYLINELEECTKAVAVGGKVFQDKWGTPDVVGVLKSVGDLINVPTEVVSAEIKLSTAELITAFGQACSYTLFSHRSYLVVPKQSEQADIKRLEALCRIVGIGLILFDKTNPIEPDFEIRLRASKQEPDMFTVNKNMQKLKKQLFD